MKTLHIIVKNKVATYQKRDGAIVCGNDDYKIKFTFDDEWNAQPSKKARFLWGGQYFDADITGDTCDVPVILGADQVEVGVYAGDLVTTTPATIPCWCSILCKGGAPHPETGQHYTTEAERAAEAAKASETNAASSASAAEASANTAGTKAVEASASATAAKASETNAASKASAAKTSETNAAASAAAAKASEESAQTIADGIMPQVERHTENLDAKIRRAEKRLTNLEQGLPDDDFVTDSGVAYAKDVPANALPFAAIESVGGMTYRSEDGLSLRSAAVTAVKSIGSNLSIFPYTQLPSAVTAYGLTFAPNADSTIKVSGTIDTSASAVIRDFNDLILPAGTYVVSLESVNVRLQAYASFSDGTTASLVASFTNGSRSFTLTEVTSVWLRLYIPATIGSVEETVKVWLNKGENALPYSPYKETSIVIPSSIEGNGLGVNDVYYNTIYWSENTVKSKRAVKQIIFTGNEEWATIGLGTESQLFRYVLSDQVTPDNAVCSRLNYQASITVSNTFTGLRLFRDSQNTGLINVRPENAASLYPSVSSWKNQLAEWYADGAPLTVVYALYSPVETDITDSVTLDNLIEVERNGLIVFENEHGLAVSTTVKYQVEVSA